MYIISKDTPLIYIMIVGLCTLLSVSNVIKGMNEIFISISLLPWFMFSFIQTHKKLEGVDKGLSFVDDWVSTKKLGISKSI